jgi:hypothetical protein
METLLSDGESDQGWDDIFSDSGGWESGCLGMVTSGDGTDSMLQF